MAYIKYVVLFCITFTLIWFGNCEIVNENVEQHLDLASQLVKKQIKLLVKDDNGDPILKYNLVLTPEERKNLAYITATSINERKLKLDEILDSNIYAIQFEKPEPSQSFKLVLVFTNSIKPYPDSIRQMDKQFVNYSGPLYFYSPYRTISQRMNVKLSTANVLSFSPIKPVSVTNNKISYGPFNNIPAFASENLTVHYENQTPFITVRQLEREIEVSHWGNIAIKENIIIYHSGAKLVGSFSRYDFQKDGRGGQSAVKSIKTILPSSASDIYYRDGNGNISTSNLKLLSDSVELELRPRFPLFGGWKTQYNLGYNVPSFEYLFNKDENYILKMRSIDHIFDEMVIDEAIVKIILPEGCSNIKLNAPHSIKRYENSLRFTYLDTTGRPVVSYSMKNLVQNHIEDFELSYNFSKSSLLQEPILIISFIFLIFFLTIILMRLDFAISTHPHKE